MNVMRRLKSIASGRTSISSDPVSFLIIYFFNFLRSLRLVLDLQLCVDRVLIFNTFFKK